MGTENEKKFMEMLTDTKTSLDEISRQHNEINNVLDLIENKRKEDRKPHTQTTSGKSGEVTNIEDEKDANAPSLRTEQDAYVSEQAGTSYMVEEETNENILSQTDKRPRAGSTDETETKPKGILKKPDKGSKLSYGFKERLNLNFDHVMYGSLLRRNAVEMHQDNRLCSRFVLPPNEGCVYESKRQTLEEVETMAIRENDTRQQGKANTLKTTLKSPEIEKNTKSVKTSVSEDGKSRDRRARINIGSHSSKSEPHEQHRPTETGNASKKRDVVNQQQPDAVSTFVQLGSMQEMSRDAYSNMMAEVVNVEGLDREDKKQMYENVLETLFGKGDTFNPAQFTNMTKDQYMESMANMLVENDGLTEENLQMIEVNANNMFGTNGKMDLLKCAQIGLPFMNKQVQELTAAVLQDGTSSDKASALDSEDNETSKTPSETPAQTSVSALKQKPKIEPKIIEEGPTEDEAQERVDIDPGVWIQYANEEVQKGRIAQDVRERGMDTIICLDVSQSMKGVAWQQATNFIKRFMEGIQNTTLMDDVYEHVALVTYGGETRVQQHLTCDYLEIIRKLDPLKPSGTSPMYAGLQMVHAAVLGAGTIFVSCGYKMHPRVFLITDGKATPAGMIAGPDDYAGNKADDLPILLLVKEMNNKYHVTINPVPVGNFELNILEKIVGVSKGKIVSPEDWRMQSRVFKNNLAAAKIGGGSFAKHLAPALARMLVDTVSHDASPEDKQQMDEFLKTHERDKDDDSDTEFEGFPPLGSRVRRYVPGASIRKQSEQGPGTVTKHMSDGHIGVTWDKPNSHGSIREKINYGDGNRGVTVVEEPRVLRDEMIAEGCRVRRGKDWHYGDQDGGDGQLGYVFLVKPDGIVKVRWDNGRKNTYLFGAGGKFDLEIIQNKVAKKKEDVPKVEFTIPSDEESEDRMVQAMNKRNRSIYDFVTPEKTETEGTIVNPSEDGNVRVGETDKNKRNVTDVPKTKDDIVNSTRIDETAKEKPTDKATARIHSKMEISHEKNATVSDVKHDEDDNINKQNMANKGAKPKTGVLKQSEHQLQQVVQWLWHDGDNWIEYPPDLCEKIEKDFKRNARGTTLIRLNDVTFRVVFPRMEKVNIETRDKYAVHRKS